MENNRFSRTRLLIGEEKLIVLKNKTVLVCGLGGVGGTALESLARSGIMNFILVDGDFVEHSNLNRQILYNEEDIGFLKVEAAKKYLLKIDKNIKIEVFNKRVNKKFFETLKHYKIDFIIDAIDQSSAKALLIKFAQKYNIPFISSLGMANRLDPTEVKIGLLNEVSGDPLAKKLKQYLKKENVATNNIPVVYSSESPLLKENYLASMMNVPSSAGLALSAFCLNYFINEL
ncbi:MAG: ThiF family adenylyltransferase [Bacilli bacterium]|jgi:tRNA A37 threonylcarbamoyladenosine dehydratase|nr:ThiF family adenylyltransferase [Bacilli bacterium]NLN80401.1 tRNA threonylcarbamoyladenosine dehydratase [Erysipelotrichia bacterium]